MYVAHAAHTLTTIAYFLPVVAFLVWLAIVQIKDRRARAASDEGGSTLPPSHLQRSDQVD